MESGMITAVSAGTGGSIAAVITTPIDVVKTRIMLAAVEGGSDDSKSTPRESVKAAKDALVDATGKTVEAVKDKPVETMKEAVRPKRSGSLQVAREIIQEQGYKGLFRGGALRGVWTMLGSGLYLGVYESGRIYLAQRRGDPIDAEEYARS